MGAVARQARRAQTRETWPEWMATATAEDYLDCGRDKLAALVKARRVVRVNFSQGKKPDYRYSKTSLDEYMESLSIDYAKEKALAIMKTIGPKSGV